jgi:hypothetical protein
MSFDISHLSFPWNSLVVLRVPSWIVFTVETKNDPRSLTNGHKQEVKNGQ